MKLPQDKMHFRQRDEPMSEQKLYISGERKLSSQNGFRSALQLEPFPKGPSSFSACFTAHVLDLSV